MSGEGYYAPGDWNAVCYFCGWKFKAGEMRRYWEGFYVCAKDWEARQPQDFVKGIADTQIPPWTQPMPGMLFASFCTPNGRTARPGFAEPGCVIPGFTDPLFDPTLDDPL